MTSTAGSADPWAWVRDVDAEATAPRSTASVTVVVVSHDGERWLPALLHSLAASAVRPRAVVLVDAGSSDATASVLASAPVIAPRQRVVSAPSGTFGGAVARGLAEAGPDAAASEWLWLLHDDVVVDPDALGRLLDAGEGGADVVGPLLTEPRRRRDRSTRVGEAGQTLTQDGRPVGVVAEGTFDQGQLAGGDVLAVNACGLLVRGSVWAALGGLDAALPSSVQGLEFCWRARAAGHRAVTQPRARLAHVEASRRGLRAGAGDPEFERRRWGLTLHEAFRADPLGGAERRRLLGASARRVTALVAGKDLAGARAERRAVAEWRADRASVDRLRAAYRAAAAPGTPDLDALRLSRRAARGRRLDESFARAADWLAGFGDRGGGPGLDALTGDDFAREDAGRRRVSWTWVVWWVLVTCALVAARRLFGGGPLAGGQLLPAPESLGALWSRYAAEVAGAAPSAGAPWSGLTWLAALPTFGHPDLLASLLLLGAVPLAFLLARRALALLVADRWVALAGAGAYALVLVVGGAVGSGQLGTVAWALLAPVAAGLVLRAWAAGTLSAPLAGSLGLVGVGLVASEPLTWLLLLGAVAALLARGAARWPAALLAGGAPSLLLVSPFTAELARFPGRLLTGIEPLLAPTAPRAPLDALLARTSDTAPLWTSAAVLGPLWLLGLAGAALRPHRAAGALASALACAAVGLALTRLVVAVPPAGLVVRPQASAWAVALAGALICAAALGLDGVRERLAGAAFGPRHLAALAASGVLLAGLIAGAGWWVADGLAGLHRGASTIPAFIRKDAAAGVDRILVLRLDGPRVAWTLAEGDRERLGDGDRGLAYGGSPWARDLAASVARRLAEGAADEQLVADLRRLGVGHLWVSGASAEQLAQLSNVPGLGVGASDETGASWVVPASGRLLLVDAGRATALAPGDAIPAGASGRTLVLAEPAGATASASLNGTPLVRAADADGRPAFEVPAAGGVVAVGREVGAPAWAIAQLAALALLVLIALPGIGTRSAPAQAPRRARRVAL